MKKLFLILLISFISTTCSYAADQVEDMSNAINDVDQKFFQSSAVPTPELEVVKKENTVSQKNDDNGHMPFFKKTRLRIQRALKVRDLKNEQKQLQKEEKKLNKANWESGESELEDIEIDYMEEEDSLDDQADESILEDKNKKEKPLELKGEVKEQSTENEMLLDCEDVSFNEKTGDIEAVGSPVLSFPPQKVKLKADKMIYNKDANILKAMGNVVLTKDGMPIYGDYIQVNMNEENILMDNIIVSPPAFKIRAQKAASEDNKIVLTNGKIYSETSNKFRFITRMIGPDFTKMIIDEKDQNLLFSGGGKDSKLRIVASDINVNSRKDHDTVQVKNAAIYRDDKYLFRLPSFTAHTNKEQEYFEANYPEFGSQSRFGMFAGPGFVFDAPFGSVVKLIPLVNYKDDFGIGGAIKYKTAFNETNLMYGTGSDIFFLRGKQKLDDDLSLQYGSNAYMDEWFFGRRMPKYLVELVYDKSKTINDFVAEGKDLTFRNRISGAYAHDGEWNMASESIKSSGVGTMRLRYMAEAAQSLYKYKDEANRKSLELSLVMQGSAAVYGTGDTQFVGRIGPNIHTQYKYWMQDIGYFISGYSDHTPMPVYDMYRYGHSNVRIREAIRLNKYLTVGWAGSITLTNDSPNGELFQENTFMVSIGPDDLKVNLGYDFMRRTTYFTVAVMFDTKGTTVDFDRMEIKNPERLGRSDRKKDEEEIAFESSSVSKTKPKLQYAEVIDIEDPNKESI